MSQQDYDVRLEWGWQGVHQLSPVSDVTIIVDVLSFTTAVDVACSRGAHIYPYRWHDHGAAEFAIQENAHLAGRRGEAQYSLSPVSLKSLNDGDRLVLPSPNGSTLSLDSASATTIAACLRNAVAVAEAVSSLGRTIAVIPAGEQWLDGLLRPALEDILGAGAIVDTLPGRKSPEADAAARLWRQSQADLLTLLTGCTSGRELIAMGFESDIETAARYDTSRAVPLLVDGVFRAQSVTTKP